MAFASDIRQFRSATDLAAYLATLPVPSWPKGSVYHNTYRPTEAQWNGAATMRNMEAEYIHRDWSAGPHFYLAFGSPDPRNDGIWQMTSPTLPGIHAGDCNKNRFGIEVVGDFARKVPSAAQQQLLIDTLAALHRWARIGPSLIAHRDCMANRTCPGDAFYALKSALQARLILALTASKGAGIYIARHPQAIFEAPAPDAQIALYDTAMILEGQEVDVDEVGHGGWGHLRSGLGFVPVGVLTKVR